MTTTDSGGLRELPIHQFLLRGQALTPYAELKRLFEKQATVSELHLGPFRVDVSRKTKSLGECGLDRVQLLRALADGCEVMEASCDPQSGHGRFQGLIQNRQLRIELAHPISDLPKATASDWVLTYLGQAKDQNPRPFARLTAEWSPFSIHKPPPKGDAAATLRDLAFLDRDRRQDGETLRRLFAETAAVPEAVGRLAGEWRRVNELERELTDWGVHRLEPVESGYRIVPRIPHKLSAWVEEQKAHSPDGVRWGKKRLQLQFGEEYANLHLRQPPAQVNGEWALDVTCAKSVGRKFLDRLCEGGWEVARLLPSDPQSSRLAAALDAFGPPPGDRGSRDQITPDDQSLRVLRAALTAADTLPPTPAWPPLPVPPLAKLSEAQEEAVRAAVATPDMTLIQGPPGTGKTTVILEILRQLFHRHAGRAGFKVLLVAPTHVAVDNVLERLVEVRHGTDLLSELRIVPYRIGDSTGKIAPHLRGFTLDCVKSDYHDQLEREVAAADREADTHAERDRRMAEELRACARHDRAAWESGLAAADSGWHPRWPDGLDAGWVERLATPTGRAEAWRRWCGGDERPARRAALVRKWLAFVKDRPGFFSELLLANANLVCGTTVGCVGKGVADVTYDYVIVDEAGKEQGRRLLVPLVRGERWVLVGDHRQLPPHADNELVDRWEAAGGDPAVVEGSLFEALLPGLKARGRFVFLDRQGRMHPDISAFVSARFYAGQLLDFPHVATLDLPTPPFLPDRPRLLALDTGRLPDCSERKVPGAGYSNPLEAELAVRLVERFVGLPDWGEQFTVGVIAPYREQVKRVNGGVRRSDRLKPLLDTGRLTIGTVDSFQGKECDLVLFSATRSNADGKFGFTDDRQRLNVALSRARRSLLVLVDRSTVDRAPPQDPDAEPRGHLQALFDHANGLGGVIEVPRDWRRRWGGA